MKKFIKLGVCSLAAVMLIAGCSKKAAEEETTTAADTVDYGTVTLGDYKGVEITALTAEVTDEEVDARISSIIAANPDYEEITDRPAQDGDIVNIDYVGTKDGTAFEGGTATGFDLTLGSNSFIDGFEAGLIGANAGDKLPLNLTFPENYQPEELAGAAVVFDVTVNSIKVEKEAVLNDEFVQKVSDFKTVDEFREDTKKDLLAEKQANIDSQKMYEAVSAVIANSEFALNSETVELDYNQQIDNYTSQAEAYGMKLEDMASIYGMDLETFQNQIREATEFNAKRQLIIDAIFEKEGMKIEAADREMVAVGTGADVDTLITQYGQETVDQVAKQYKVSNFLVENAVEVEKPVETTVAETSSEAASVEETSSEEASADETTAGDAAETSADETIVEETTAAK